jgi:hypothetical protein
MPGVNFWVGFCESCFQASAAAASAITRLRLRDRSLALGVIVSLLLHYKPLCSKGTRSITELHGSLPGPFETSCIARIPQRPAEQGARPGDSPRVPGFPEHAPGTRATRVHLLVRAEPPFRSTSTRKRMQKIHSRCMGQPHVFSQAPPAVAVGRRPLAQELQPLWQPSGSPLRPCSMVDRLQNFQRAGFRIARVVHLHTGSQIRVQVGHGSLGRFWHRRL